MAAIFLAAERSEWDSLTLLEHRTDRERTRRVFEEANARYKASIQSRHQPFRVASLFGHRGYPAQGIQVSPWRYIWQPSLPITVLTYEGR